MALFPKPKPIDLQISTTHGDARFADEADLPRDLLKGGGIPLGWLWSPELLDKQGPNHWGPRLTYTGDRHLITVAPSRAGKGTTTIIPSLLEYPASAIVIDPKGQNAAVTAERRRADLGHKVFCLNPFGVHTGAPWNLPRHAFNPLSVIDRFSENFIADVHALSEALIVTEGKDPHWSNSARDLVAALILYVLSTEGEEQTLGRVRQLLTRGHEKHESFWEFMEHISKTGPSYVRQKAARFALKSNDIHAVVSTAMTQTSFLDDPAIVESLKESSFRFADLKAEGVTVYLILPSRYIEAYSRWLRLFIVTALNELTATPKVGGRLPVLFLLDEFAQLGHLAAIESAMGMAAGYGIQLWPILQDLNQAKHLYGERWETFLANAGITQYATPNDNMTADYISKRAGQRTAQVRAVSVREISIRESTGGFSGASDSFNEVGVPLLTTGNLFGFDSAKSLLFAAGLQFPIIARRLPYHRWESLDGLFDRDPYHPASTPGADTAKPRPRR